MPSVCLAPAPERFAKLSSDQQAETEFPPVQPNAQGQASQIGDLYDWGGRFAEGEPAAANQLS